MGLYLDDNGLKTVWDKSKSTFLRYEDISNLESITTLSINGTITLSREITNTDLIYVKYMDVANRQYIDKLEVVPGSDGVSNVQARLGHWIVKPSDSTAFLRQYIFTISNYNSKTTLTFNSTRYASILNDGSSNVHLDNSEAISIISVFGYLTS